MNGRALLLTGLLGVLLAVPDVAAEAEAPEGTFTALYEASGVIDSAGFASVVACANIGPAGPLEIVFYDEAGAVACITTVPSVATATTYSIATRDTLAYVETANCAGPVIAKGRVSIRVEAASSANFICTAQVIEADVATPSFVASLELHRR
jgi:hypothetical protein